MDSMVERSPPPPHHHEGKRIVRASLQFLIGLMVLGWVMLWIMKPTSTYRSSWTPKLRAGTNSTYFGIEGTNLLIFTFPILLTAVLGCLYLHLGKNKGDIYNESNSKNQHRALWRRPVLMKGPLGIVTAIEVAFLFMFIALLIWSFLMYLLNSFSKITVQSSQENGETVWEAKLESVGHRFGVIGNICLAFLFFPVARGSSIFPLIGLTFEAGIKYHIWLGNIAMTLFTAHGICNIIYWIMTNQIYEMLKWDKIGVSNVAGEIALLAGLAMWVTSYPRIRRRMFELFFYTHYLYLLFVFFFVLHVGVNTFYIVLPGIYLFLVDRFLRFLQSRRRVRVLSARLLPCETVELNFAKSPGLIYAPSSIVFIKVSTISALQWHPFSVTSNCNMDPTKLTVIIKSEGSWTRKLHQTLSSPSPIDHLDVSLEGPYGPISTNFIRHDLLVLVSGGSGITPFISIIRELIFRSSMTSYPTPKVVMICSFKNSVELRMLDFLLPAVSTIVDMSRLDLQIEAFVTREKEPTIESQKRIQNVRFKYCPWDTPVSAVLGPNSWIFLGAIIFTSFAMFLLLLSILTHYYIYPIDHNTNKIYPYSLRSLINMLVLLFCIVATASIATLWNKRHSTKEEQKIQNVDDAIHTNSLNALFENEDPELESLPHQSIVQSTNVHYGTRPDLKKMLSEIEGSSVGVFASGPRTLVDDVATICSSSLADNLHFESFSFSL